MFQKVVLLKTVKQWGPILLLLKVALRKWDVVEGSVDDEAICGVFRGIREKKDEEKE